MSVVLSIGPPRSGLRMRHRRPLSLVVAAALTVPTAALFAIVAPGDWHWFVLPVTFCGIIIGIDAVDVIRGRVSIFDPVGLLGAVGLHFFFLAPLLHVQLQHWMLYVEPPTDWRDWLGWMAVVNLAGLSIYRITCALSPPSPRSSSGCTWTLEPSRFRVLLAIGLVATAALQAWVYSRTGGMAGFVEAFTDGDLATASQGLGWVYMISESFPILAMFGVLVFLEGRKARTSWLVLGGVLLLFLAARMLFGGLRGSRSNTIWALFWAAGMIHYRLRPIPRRALAVGALFVVGFMYAYGFYKASGTEAVEALRSAKARAEMSEGSGRTLSAALLGDLARSDVQAFLLFRSVRSDSDVRYALGRTYAGAAALLVPGTVWPDRPVGKVKEGTDVQYGRGSYRGPGTGSSRVYGLAGEALLNFGLLGALASFGLLGWVVARTQRFAARLQPGDVRLFLVPFLANWCLVLLVGDSDNVVFFGFKNGLVPFLLLLLSSRRIRITDRAAITAS